jgi:cyanophycinase
MITGDEAKNNDSSYSFVTIEKGNVITSEGFGFIEDAIVDQHFIFRKRQNRLISLVLENPNLLGIGIDEETSIIVNNKMEFQVLGEYQVIVYDASDSKISINSKEQFGAENIKHHILNSNDRFDIKSKKVLTND